MSDEQMSMDLGTELTPSRRSEWDEWVDPQRRATQVRKFLHRADLPALPPKPWDFESDEAYQISDMIGELFPDTETAKLPESRDLADQLACTIGEWFTRYINAQWCDMTRYADMPAGFNDTTDMPLYRNFKPCVVFEFDNWRSCTAEFLVQYVIENEFIHIVELSSVGFHRRDNLDSIRKMRDSLPGYPPFINS